MGGEKGRLQLRRGRRNQTQSSLETCLGEMIRIADPAATVKAITKALARAVSTTREVRTREADANVTTAKRSLTRMAGYMEPAKGQTTPDATGAIQLDGQTLDVVICNLLKGSQTTPGPTELVLI